MNNAATSALRLHQRVPRVQFTRQFLETLLLEDSCHYLFYSLIFLYAAPVTCILSIYIYSLFNFLNVSYFDNKLSPEPICIQWCSHQFFFSLWCTWPVTLLHC